jgi:hypothetical protein
MQMFGSTTLAVVIGLVFVYFVFSMICSTINETVAARLSWRSRGLESWLRKSLDPPGESNQAMVSSDRLKKSSLITSITPERSKSGLPSYLSPGTFSLAVLDVLSPGDDQVKSLVEVKSALAELPEGHPAKAPLTRVALEAHDLAEFRAGVEGWFNDSMARVSGWYKRRVRRWMLVYAAVVTLVLNVDTIVLARSIWGQDTVRQAVVAQVARGAQAPAPGQDASAGANLNDVSRRVAEVKGLDLPIGWAPEKKHGARNPDPRRWPGNDLGGLLVKALGLGLTVGALSLGGPFWFDLLSKVSRLRASGERPSTGASQPTPAPNQPIVVVQPQPTTG